MSAFVHNAHPALADHLQQFVLPKTTRKYRLGGGKTVRRCIIAGQIETKRSRRLEHSLQLRFAQLRIISGFFAKRPDQRIVGILQFVRHRLAHITLRQV